MPEHHAPDGKGVTKIMKPWRRMAATIHPTQAVAQRIEHAMGLPIAKWLPQSPATAADEEGHIGRRGNMPRPLPPVARQSGDGARMHGQLA